MPSENWKKFLQKKKTAPAAAASTSDAAAASPASPAPKPAADDDVAAAIAHAVAVVASHDDPVAPASNEPDADRDGASSSASDNDDDEGEDLLDALAGGKPVSLPTSVHEFNLSRIPAAFRPALGAATPTTTLAWFAHLNAVDGVVPGDTTKLGKYVALDCEMVGVGPDGIESALARVSLVNFHGHTVLDTHVAPAERVTDFRTAVSGITPASLKGAPPMREVVAQVAEILKDRILVGHSLGNDFDAMLLNHPKHLVRDTASYSPFHEALRTSNPALRNLARAFLGLTVQQGEHDSIEDARVAMLLYRLHRDEWEQYLRKLAKGEIKLPMSSKRKKSSQHWDRMRNKNKRHKNGRVENNKRGKGRPQPRGKPIGGDAA